MNRAQRRAQVREQARRRNQPVAQQLEPIVGPLNMEYGHSDTQLLVRFSRPTDHVWLTPQQADEMVAAIQGVKEKLLARQAANG